MFVVIEGIDGSGKGTISSSIVSRMRERGLKADLMSFPGYGETMYSKLIAKYLNGDFGDDTHPYLHGTLYAMDWFEHKFLLEARIATNDVLVSDRYIPSNLCYSSMKIPDSLDSQKEQREVAQFFSDFEYGVLKMPVPDLIIFLDVPVKFAIQNIAKKAKREYTELKFDLHESNENYLHKVRGFYCSRLEEIHPKTNFEVVNCERTGHLLSLDKIGDQVENLLLTYLTNEADADA